METKTLLHLSRFIVPTLIFFALFFTLAPIDTIQLQKSRFALNYNASQIFNVKSPSEDMKIFMGILTLPDLYDRRNIIRLAYRTQPPPVGARIDFKFVFCNLTKEEQRVLVSLEIMRYDDIIILDCKENMNDGKTYTYFSSLPRLLESSSRSPPYDFVMKVDDDTYFRLQYLVDSLKNLTRQELYYGLVIPCAITGIGKYMAGMGYLLSYDLVKWISVSDIPKHNLVGPEDKMVGKWLEEGHHGKNRHNTLSVMYDFEVEPAVCSHKFWSETVAVHRLKSQERWVTTLKYFNATLDLTSTPSRRFPYP